MFGQGRSGGSGDVQRALPSTSAAASAGRPAAGGEGPSQQQQQAAAAVVEDTVWAPVFTPEVSSVLDVPLLRQLPLYLQAMQDVPALAESVFDVIARGGAAAGGGGAEASAGGGGAGASTSQAAPAGAAAGGEGGAGGASSSRAAQRRERRRASRVVRDAFRHVSPALSVFDGVADPALSYAPAAARPGNWTPPEDGLLIIGLKRFGPDWALIQDVYLPRRTVDQVRLWGRGGGEEGSLGAHYQGEAALGQHWGQRGGRGVASGQETRGIGC